jgi:hypothetical protein
MEKCGDCTRLGVGETDRIPVFLGHTKPLGSSESIEWSHQNHNYESVAFQWTTQTGLQAVLYMRYS